MQLIRKQFYLHQRYPIRDQTGGRDLPSCRYIWPNGQGDEGKFLSGIENSAAWKKRYGNIYRIWSGMKPEVYVAMISF